MIKAAIIGATGYAGEELVRILACHPEVELVSVSSQSYVGQPISAVYPNLLGCTGLTCEKQDAAAIVTKSDVVFVALPHGHAVPVAKEAMQQGKRVIDLGADFRFSSPAVYADWYGITHGEPPLLNQAVYGLPEIHRARIKEARLVGNPGCYPTSAILALAPALAAGIIVLDTIIIDSKSGVSGAGRGLALGSLYAEVNENINPYNVAKHRHTPEIEQEFSLLAGETVRVTFTPHLTPMTRGILSTVYARVQQGLERAEVQEIYARYYQGELFVKILPEGQWPHTKWVTGSNQCQLNLTIDTRTRRLVVASAIDNLVKGAAGQAVQNMNLMFSLPENTGLKHPGLNP